MALESYKVRFILKLQLIASKSLFPPYWALLKLWGSPCVESYDFALIHSMVHVGSEDFIPYQVLCFSRRPATNHNEYKPGKHSLKQKTQSMVSRASTGHRRHACDISANSQNERVHNITTYWTVSNNLSTDHAGALSYVLRGLSLNYDIYCVPSEDCTK